MSCLKVKFNSFKEVDNHIEYFITLIDQITCQKFCYYYRYSELRKLHTTINKNYPAPAFPSKKLFGTKNPKFLQKRKKDLENYFNKIFSDLNLFFILFNSPYFQVPQSQTEKYKLISNQVISRLINVSVHPGPLNPSEYSELKEGYQKKINKLKIQCEFYNTKKPSKALNKDCILSGRSESAWLSASFYIISQVLSKP